MNNMILVMEKIICSKCREEIYVFFKGRPCAESFSCVCGFYPFRQPQQEEEINNDGKSGFIPDCTGVTSDDSGNECEEGNSDGEHTNSTP